MKKGDIKKQEILETAEIFFCRNGYVQTSIQDILDQLKCSKGSFYHHFPSKEALLEGICRMRAHEVYLSVSPSVNEKKTNIENLNTVLSGMIPFQNEKLSFLLMLLPVFNLPDGRIVRLSYCEALSEQFCPILNHILKQGNQQGDLFSPEPGIAADLILSIVNRLWTEICCIIIHAEENYTEADLSDLLRLSDTYRTATEKIVSLPYGSLNLVDIPTLRSLSEQIHIHWQH